MSRNHRMIPALVSALLAAALLAGCSSDAVASRKTTRPATTGTETLARATTDAYNEPCFNPYGGMCLGPLDPGTYKTQVFEPAIRYTVPEGWVNAEDLPGNFLLYRSDDPQAGPAGGSYIGIYTDIRAPKHCQEAWADGVGHTPAELATWYVQHPGLATSQPRQVEVGGLDGLMVDVPLKEDWQGRCPWSQGRPVVPVIIGSGVSELHHVSMREIDVRLVLLKWKDTNVTIEITSVKEQHSQQQYLQMVEPIIKSLRFHRS
jgi:hypothetical protein